ncbi:hypothetical protein ACFQMA_22750 [Halosimplex aquaticum]|uniref:ABC-2 type transport system permease protein n=1 Tax=Halosimplex aquaticum TaxID=3026162 RepID=A0ABD5YAC2_9EURY|nr:hypothetical protein [Halosimplex aquaticum]
MSGETGDPGGGTGRPGGRTGDRGGGLSTRLLARMMREEWRLQAELFGDRFAAFPFAVAAFAGVGVWLLTITGTPMETIAAGLHGLVFFFGLQVGTIGLVGRDALRDVLGDVTLLVFSARTLPVSWRRLLAVFLVKDLLYYSGLFLAPLALGYAAVTLSAGVPPAHIALFWLTTTGTFALGVGTSLTLSGVGTRSRAVVLALVAALAAGVVTGRLDLASLSPYGFYLDPSLRTAVSGFGPVVALAVVGPLAFRPADDGAARSAPDRYSSLRSAIRDDRGITTRTVLEIARSSGSVWKVLFSMGVLFGVTVLLVQQVADATALAPSYGIAVGTFLGLGAFTTYSRVTQFDSADEYLRYPVAMDEVFAGKRAAYLLLSVPAGLVYLALSLVWLSPAEVAIGAVIFPLVAVYVFGVTAYVTGFSPNELLFDTPLFVAFGAALAVVSIPLVVAALVYSEAPTTATPVAVGVSLVAALVGVALSRRAGPRWNRKLR